MILFQFHKGTIRTLVVHLYKLVFVIFQFHKGTIRTVDTSSFNLDDKLFQFHKGTIRTIFCLLMVPKFHLISIP